MRFRKTFLLLCFASFIAAVAFGQKETVGVAGHPELNVTSNTEANLIGKSGNITINFHLSSKESVKGNYRIETKLVDWEGETQFSKSIPVQYRGRSLNVDWKLTVDQYGPLKVKADLVNPAGIIVTSQALGLVRLVAPVELSEEQRMRSSIGLNVHAKAQWSLFEQMGIHWARDYSFGWLSHGTRPPVGDNSINLMTAAYDKALTSNVIILPCMQNCYQNKSKTGFLLPDVVAKGYEKLANTFPKLPYWEVENEYDTPLREVGKDTVDNWGPFLEAVHEGVERSDTDAKVVMNGRAGIHLDFTRELLDSKYADNFFVVNYHYYTGTVPPEVARSNKNDGQVDVGYEVLSYLDQLREVNRLAHEHGKEGWLTEAGYDVTYGPAVGIRNQAILLSRLYLTARWAGSDKIFWFFDRDVPGSKQKFGSCGLIDLNGNVRPAGAAIAALSRETATARVLGRVDLDGNPNTWCLVLEKEDGGYVVPVWTVTDSIPLPAVLKSRSTQVVDLFGNTIAPTHLGPEVRYFHMDRLPVHWSSMMETDLLSSSVVEIGLNESVTVEMRAPQGTTFRWKNLPEGVTADNLTISVTSDVHPKEYPVLLEVSGDDWSKVFSLILVVSPAFNINSEPYLPGSVSTITIQGNEQAIGPWSLASASSKTRFEPAEINLKPGEDIQVKLIPSEEEKGPLIVSATAESGLKQSFRITPALLSVPEAKFDASSPFPEVWTNEGSMTSDYFISDELEPGLQAQFAWSPDGLVMAIKLPAKDMREGNPHSFWEGTNIELFIATDKSAGSGWNDTSHQFFFVPYKSEGNWLVSAGEWKRSGAIPATIRDDKRLKTEVIRRHGSYTIIVFIPSTALNLNHLKAGIELAAAIAVRRIEGTLNDLTDYSWPRSKDDGILDGVKGWGTFRLIR